MSLDQVRKWVEQAERIAGFTGAGVSTESGIPDFRSPNGIWARNRLIYFDEFVHNREDRIEYWRQKVENWPELRDAQPNDGHRAFAELDRRGKLLALITQNIDGLHQKAGLDPAKVHEIHGSTVYVTCLAPGCDFRVHSDVACEWVEQGDPAPECPDCGGLLKPSTISFGQPMPEGPMRAAEAAARQCDLFLVAGSSLVVYPAAALPQIAKQSGARLILINRDETPLDGMADAVIRGEIGAVLPAVVDLTREAHGGE